MEHKVISADGLTLEDFSSEVQIWKDNGCVCVSSMLHKHWCGAFVEQHDRERSFLKGVQYKLNGREGR